MWCLLWLTSSLTDFDLVSGTGDLDRLLSVPPASFARARLRDNVLLHNALGSALHTPLYPGGTSSQPDAVLSEVRRVGASRVLELGFGKGYNSLRLASACPNVTFVGYDEGDGRVSDARSRAHLRNLSNVVFEASTATSCAGTFDVVFSIESLRVTEPTALFESLRGCLRPGGSFVLVDAFTADGVLESSGESRTALRLVEAGLGTRVMPSVSHWRGAGGAHGFTVHRAWNWTSRALPFWDAGAWASRRAMYVYRWLPASARGPVVASLMAPHALRGGSAVYGGLVLHREL